VLLATIAAGAAWFWVSPRRTWDRLLFALVTGDAATLETVVDFPSVRMHLREDLRTAFDARTGRLPLSAGPAIGSAVVDPIVDMVVTPKGLEQLITAFGIRTPSANTVGQIEERTIVTYRYHSPSRVDVRVRSSAEPVSSAGLFTFMRSGVRWRLARVWSDRLASNTEGR